jgi:hypothetical protein
MSCRLDEDANSFCRAAENLFRTAYIRVSKETLHVPRSTARIAACGTNTGETPTQNGMNPAIESGRTRQRKLLAF